MASQKYRGMHHIAYEMRDPNHLISMLDNLAHHGYRLHWGPGRHGPGQATVNIWGPVNERELDH